MALGSSLVPLNPPRATVAGFGLGCAPIGDLYTAVDDGAAEDTVRAALAAGIRFFDTAPHYGAGKSEARLGRGLRGVARDEYTLATKVGLRVVDADGRDTAPGEIGVRTVSDLSADGVLRSVESSLLRLGLDRVDVLYLHDPNDVDRALGAAIPSMLRLREEGIVRSIGVGMNHSAPLTRFVREADIDLVMVAGRWTLLDRSAQECLLPAAQARHIEVVAAAVFNTGILADPSDGARFDYAPASDAMIARARMMQARCSARGIPLSTAAVHFPFRHPAVGGVVVGARSADEVRAYARDISTPVPEELWQDLDE